WGWGLLAFYDALTEETAGQPALRSWLWLGVALGVGMLAKYAMAAFVLSAGLVFVCVPVWRPIVRKSGPWLALALGAVVFSPNIFWNAANHFVSFAHTQANANLGAGGVHPMKALEFVGAQFGVFGPILFAVLLASIVALFRRRPDPAEPDGRGTIFLAAFAVPLLLIMTVEGFLSRANANWAAPAYVAGSLWVVFVLARRDLWIKAALGLHVLAALVMVNYDSLAHLAGVDLSAKTDPMKRVRGWDRLGRALGDVIALDRAAGTVLAFDERKVLTPMLYYLPRPHPVFAKWNADRHIDDHYDLTVDLGAYAGREVVLVTRRKNVSEYASAFSGPISGPMVVSVPIHEDYTLTLNVFQMGRFIGYSSQAH
ncbi:MAG: glycosyltransferase family 39 protein, partial [Rhodospirillaceae bacterium]|nr:glycosyltransferase family 39 protein [Rhodospirillaceae bacterium]